MQESQMSLQDFRKDTNSLDPTVTHDDVLYQLLSGLQTTPSWPDMSAGYGGDGQNKSTPPWNSDHFDDPSVFLSPNHHHHHHHQIPAAGGGDGSSNFKPPINGDNSSIQNLFHGLTGSLTSNQTQNYGSLGAAAPVTTAGGGGGAPSQRRQRVRARRGQATDPHSIAERLRRERIAERMKALQELVPNANNTDKASMLDDIVDYVKFLQLQVKVLSMSRLGGAASDPVPAEGGGGGSTTVTEKQVVKLMEENMGSAMQYLQGKGLCLMPISLATSISAGCGGGEVDGSLG